MSSARDEIFANIRRALGVKGREAPRLAEVENRSAQAPQGVVPARGHLPPTERKALFRAQAERIKATVAEVAAASDVPTEIARYLRENNWPATLRMGADPFLAAMPWKETVLDVTQGRSYGQDLNGISHALGGVAETGTLAMMSGPDNPTTLNFLPDHHIVVLRSADIVGDYESIWPMVRARYGKGQMPRALNFITGPSRTADIAQTLLLGVHGPRTLHIVLVGEA